MDKIQIAIDGPSGAGKSTVARRVAKELGYTYVDTGALYRAVGLFMYHHGIDPEDEAAVTAALVDVHVDLSYDADGVQQVFLNGVCVSDAIRHNDIYRYASCVSAFPAVRDFLLDTQRALAKRFSVVMDGRDIGTVIFPQAKVKIFLFASPEQRAKRRAADLEARGQKVDVAQLLVQMQERDTRDMQRTIAPAVPAPDAVLLDSSSLNFEQTVSAVLAIVRERSERDI